MVFSESVSEQLVGREPCFRSSDYFDVFVEEARKKGYPEISGTRSPSGTGPAPLVGVAVMREVLACWKVKLGSSRRHSISACYCSLEKAYIHLARGSNSL